MHEHPAPPVRRARRLRSGGLTLAALAGGAAIALAGCGNGANTADPQAVAAATPPSAAVAPAATGAAAQVPRDSEEAASFPLPAGQKAGPQAPHPSDAAQDKVATTSSAPAEASDAGAVSPGAPSDAEIRAELKQMKQAQAEQARSQAPVTGADAAQVDGKGTAAVPAGAPAAIARVIAGGNAIAHFPYIWGGGHDGFVDNGYDCSGSVSYALATGGLLRAPLVSGELAHYGAKGPGRWITIYANETHVFMYVAGLRFDTSGRDGPFGSRWQTAPRSLAGFAVRHPVGY